MKADRKAITKGLSTLLEKHLSANDNFWAKEVSIETLDRCRPDYVAVSAHFGKFASLSSIERAVVSVYEVKSCLADYKSGHGLNAVGDVNYIVAPYELIMKLTEMQCDGEIEQIDKLGLWGTAYPFPESHGRVPDVANLPVYEGQVDGWRLYWIEPNFSPGRNQPISTFLWSMMYAGVNR